MKKQLVKFAALVALFFAVVIGFAAGGGSYRQSGFVFAHDAKGNIWRYLVKNVGAVDAWAQQPAGGSAGGAPQVPVVGQIVGQVTVAAGTNTTIIPQIGYSPVVYTHCFVSVLSPLPPVAGDVPGCAVTSTATIIASATATVGAINIQVAGTPSPSPVVQYILTP